MLAHTYAFTNKLINHDEIVYLFGKGATYDSGRWGLNIISNIFPNYSMPWLYGIISIVLIAVSACLIINIFEIDSTVLKIGLSSMIMVFPSLIGTFSYMFTSSSYAVSFLLAVLAVFWFEKGINAKKKSELVFSLIALILSLSIYQAYLSLVLSLFVILCMKKLFSEDFTCKEVFIQCIQYVVFVVVAVAIYYGITQVVLSCFIQFSTTMLIVIYIRVKHLALRL